DCNSCGVNCPSREGGTPNFAAPANANSRVKKVIGVVSGKGGVGKSLVTSLMAALMRRRGHSVAILDADVTGPSIPRAFGVHTQLFASEDGIIPAVSATGVKMVSLNLMLKNETDPVVWRGPIIAGTVKQFWEETVWGQIDTLFVDMPPGTGDVPLTVFQSLPVDGVVVVTTPQDLVSMIVAKAVNMARLMNIPVLGLVENMSYFRCDQCGKVHSILGESHLDAAAARFGIDAAASLPIDPAIARVCDAGALESYQPEGLEGFVAKICKQ
ncbi:MAG: Mrp/NBP35 family ATP-binding protein, partial [Thermoguttaceae bacterium]|nr:Mrp/NBP35 family ATP-binding protein [Thermoguttaceae bacterium]